MLGLVRSMVSGYSFAFATQIPGCGGNHASGGVLGAVLTPCHTVGLNWSHLWTCFCSVSCPPWLGPPRLGC